MINFFSEIEEKFKLPFLESDKGYKVIYLLSGAYIEGHIGILELGNNKISFKTKSGIISFIGLNLSLQALEKDCAAIKGKIEKIERED